MRIISISPFPGFHTGAVTQPESVSFRRSAIRTSRITSSRYRVTPALNAPTTSKFGRDGFTSAGWMSGFVGARCMIMINARRVQQGPGLPGPTCCRKQVKWGGHLARQFVGPAVRNTHWVRHHTYRIGPRILRQSGRWWVSIFCRGS